MAQNVILSNVYSRLEPFDPSATTFQTWVQLFEEFCVAYGVPAEPDPVAPALVPDHNQKRAFFLSSIGARSYEILRTSCLPNQPNTKSIPQLIAILTDRYDPPSLKRANRLTFSKRVQNEGESASEFLCAIQELAARCEFGTTLEDSLLDRLIAGIRHDELRRKLLATPNLTYTNAKSLIVQDEVVRKEARALAQSAATSQVHKVHQDSGQKFNPKPNSTHSTSGQNHHQSSSSSTNSYGTCHRCGKLHDVNTCNKKNWRCARCQKIGHIPEVCRGQVVNNSQQPLQSNQRQFNNRNSNQHQTNDNRNFNQRQHNTQRAHHLSVNNEPSIDEEVENLLNFTINHISCKPDVPDFSYTWCDSFFPKCDPSCDSSDQCASLDVDTKQCDAVVSSEQCNTSSFNVNNTDARFILVSSEDLPVLTDKGVEPPNLSFSEHRVALTSPNSPLFVDVKVNNVDIKMEVDTGAGTSIVSESFFKQNFPSVHLNSTNTALNSVSGAIQVKGEALLDVEIKGKSFQLPILCCENIGDVPPLCGRVWLDEIAPVWRHSLEQVLTGSPITCASVYEVSTPSVEHLRSLFPRPFDLDADSVIEGFLARLILQDNAIPIFHKAYPVPFGFIEAVDKVIDLMVAVNKLLPIRTSEWASPGVAVPKKDGGVRFCVDFKRTLNPQLRVDHYPLPRPDDVFAMLHGGTYFTSLDLTDAYTQLELHPESQDLCVVNTHRGLFKFLRLIYGINSAAPIFQHVMDCILAGIPGVICYIDNILIVGKTLQQCIERTLAVLSRLEKHNVRLKLIKCLWFVQVLEFLGFLISKEGRKPTQSLTSAIVNCKTPSDKKQLRSFLSTLTFYAQFLPNYSAVAKPLRELTSDKVPFVWTTECDLAFQKCKNMLISSELLIHYDPDLPIVVYADGSPDGVGAMLGHTVIINGKKVDKPICYASSSLTPAQQNYAQIDREALSVIFSVTKFHRYLWGRKFTLITDNSGIQRILHHDKSLPVRTGHRLQHWATILQGYSYTLIHKKSEFLAPADFLSRLPVSTLINEVHIVELPPNLPLTPEIIAEETYKDPILYQVYQHCLTGWPVRDMFKNNPALSPYFKLRDSLTIVNKCLLMSARVIIPQKLQSQVLSLLHEGHPGIVRTKMLARSVVWWTTLNVDIETLCNNCKECSIVNFTAPKMFVPWPSAKFPFERVHIDFFESRSLKFFITCDAFSKWLNIQPMITCTAEDVEQALLSTFSNFGLSKIMVSDNGPPFDSAAYAEFLTRFNIQILHSPPYSPQSNGLAERGVQIAKKSLEKLLLQFYNPDQKNTTLLLNRAIHVFLFNYRNTPTTTTLKTPNELLLNFKPRTLLNQLLPVPVQVNSSLLFNDNEKVFVRFGKKMPVLEGVIVKSLGPTRYIVSIEGVLKHVHANQIARTKK